MMTNVYYDRTANRLYIDRGSSVITVPLPENLKPDEVSQVIGSETMQAIITALLDV